MNSRKLRWAHAAAVLACAIALASGCGDGAAPPKPPENEGSSAGAEAKTPAGAGSAQAVLVAEGREAYKSCGMCHSETDPKITWDEDWVLLNEKTTCIESGAPAPRVRKAIMAYLRAPDILRPVLVGADWKPPAGMKTGKITIPAIGGSAYLKAERESIKEGAPPMVRLYWGEGGDVKQLTAPAGEYTVINYWLYKRGGKDGGERWSASCTNVDGCQNLSIAEGEECVFQTDPILRGSFDVQKTEGKIALSFALYDIGGNRVTLSRNGRIVFPAFSVFDGGDRELAKGEFGVS